jgi:hypothetical protein
VSLTTADKAFAAIALQKGYVTKDVLAAKEAEVAARPGSIALADYLVDQYLLDKKKKDEIERIRARHGRTCEACAKETFLLPGDVDGKKPCEFCGGKLKSRSAIPSGVPTGKAPSPVVTAGEPTPEPSATVRRPIPTLPKTPLAAAAEPSPTPSVEPPQGTPRTLERARPEIAAKPPEKADAPSRAKNLRLAGGGFGYEPPPEKPAAPPEAPAAPAAPPEAPASAEPPPEVAPASPAPIAVRGLVAHGTPGAPRPATPLAAEAIRILTIPLRGRGSLFITLGSLLTGFFVYLATHSLGMFAIYTIPPMGLVLIYFNAFQQKTANAATAGLLDLPDWPDWDETIGLGLRLLLVELATFGPFLVVLFPLFFGSAKKIALLPTIGNGADGMARKNPPCVGKNVANEVLYDKDDTAVRLGDRHGRWLVLALLEKDTGDDTGMDALARSLPQIGPGLLYVPVAQPLDLVRVGKALPDVDMAVVFIDPGLRYFKRYGIVFDEPSPRAPVRETPSGDDDEMPDRSHPIDVNKLPFVSHATARPKPAEIAGISQFLRTHEFEMPGALGGKSFVPTVWVLDPSGVVRREFQGGVRDQVLYAALKDLKAGGNGAVDPELLPLAAYGLEEPVGLEILAWILAAAGVLYYPMALLMATIFTSGAVAFQYPIGLAAIAKTAKDYFLLVVLLGATLLGARFLSAGLSIALRSHLGLLGGVLVVWVRAWLSFYGALVVCVGIGRFYVRHERTLAWLTPGDSVLPAPADPRAFADAPDPRFAPPTASAAPRFAPPPAPTATAGPSFAPKPAPTETAGPRFAASFPPPPLDAMPRFNPSASPLGRALGLLGAIPRQVEIALVVLGIVVGVLGLRSEMQYWTFDQAAIDAVGRLNRMNVDVRGELVAVLKKQGFDVAPGDIQLTYYVKYNANGDLIKAPEAFLTVQSSSAGFYRQCRLLVRSMGGVGFETTDDPSTIWPAPTGREKLRVVVILGGFLIAAVFGVKTFLFSRG